MQEGNDRKSSGTKPLFIVEQETTKSAAERPAVSWGFHSVLILSMDCPMSHQLIRKYWTHLTKRPLWAARLCSELLRHVNMVTAFLCKPQLQEPQAWGVGEEILRLHLNLISIWLCSSLNNPWKDRNSRRCGICLFFAL